IGATSVVKLPPQLLGAPQDRYFGFENNVLHAVPLPVAQYPI
ncbi:MAG TPA: 5-dehydro-4-deoxyglucarate dehydratase, partial [Cyanobacteria bacterium UBA11371]|nr:5-dehydro-4-deoxyglucarate dehydratase [Cyanobacteria bacterium UBA11371]